jgi:hypothetical protein
MRLLLTKSYLYVFYFKLQAHRETDRFLATSGVQLAQTNFHFRRAAFSSQLKAKVDNILTKAAEHYGLT